MAAVNLTLDTTAVNGGAAQPVVGAPAGAPVPVLNTTTGVLVVPPGTPAGVYNITYKLCEKLNPTNCDTAVASVTVDPSPIVAGNDSYTNIIAGTTPNPVGNALINDTINGQPVTLGGAGNATLVVKTPATGAIVPTLDPATGGVSVPPGTPAGPYTIVYTICEKLNANIAVPNCKDATITVTVNAPTIVATNDAMPSTNGATGGTPALNVLTNDSINAITATTVNTTLAVKTVATPIAGNPNVPTLSAAGVVTVLPGTPAGTYTIVYTLCDAVNTTNCKDATVTIPVTAAPIVANPDVYTPTFSGATGGSAGNVLSTEDTAPGTSIDTLNNNPVAIAAINLTVTTPAQPVFGAPAGNTNVPFLEPATGNVTVPANTPAGDYTITYKICEKLNPTNCSETTAKVTVGKAPIDAVNDVLTSVNGAAGSLNAGNAFTGDTLNSVAATAADGKTTLNQTGTAATTFTSTAPGATPVTATGTVPALNLTSGVVSVPAGTPAGTYVLTYKLCETLNPSNCDTATITVPVAAPLIDAKDDTYTAVNGATGNTNVGNVVTGAGTGSVGDTINGAATTMAAVNLTLDTTAVNGGAAQPVVGAPAGAPVPVLNTTTGVLVVPPGTPAGVYNITYKLCEKLNPTNCDTAIAKVTVDPSPIVAGNDSYTGINGATGNPNVGSALVNDLVNSAPATVGDGGNATLSINTPAVSIGGAPVPTLNTSTGVVSVLPGTPAGLYVINYKLCEKLNPTNCKDAVITVTVDKSEVLAVNDVFPGASGATGNPNIGNALSNDTINGAIATVGANGNAVLTVLEPATPTKPGAPVPSVDPATGIVSIPPGTPGGAYVIKYKLCEKLNPTNCKEATITVPIAAIDVVKAVGVPKQVGPKVFEVSYSIVVANVCASAPTGCAGTPTSFNVQVNDNLKPTFPTAASITVSNYAVSGGANGAICTPAGTPFQGTAAASALFSGANDLTGGQSCVATFKVTVDFGTADLPTSSQNNLAYASAVASDTVVNPGYTYSASGAPIAPANAVATDISTSAPATSGPPGTLPATPLPPTIVGGDSATGVPTGVIFAVQDDGALSIKKSTVTKITTAGEVVEYSIVVSSTSSTPTKTKVTDKPPVGFEYVAGSAKVNGAASSAPTPANGELIFDVGNVPAKSSIELRYQMKLGDAVEGGEATNCVFAKGVNTLTGTDKDSAQSCATVIVQTGLFLREASRRENGRAGRFSRVFTAC